MSTNYRIVPIHGGLEGYWAVKKKWRPFALIKFSIFSYGNERAYSLAEFAYRKLSQQDTPKTVSQEKRGKNAPTNPQRSK